MKIIANQYESKDIFKFIRENTGLTQIEFGKSIDRKRRIIIYYEDGGRRYTFSLLLKIAKLYGLSISIKDSQNKIIVLAHKYTAGETLKKIREYFNLNHKDFAKAIKKTDRSIYYYENDEMEFYFDLLLIIANLFDLNIIIEDNKN